MFLDPALRKSSQLIIAGSNSAKPEPKASARAASESADSGLRGRIYAAQCDLEQFVDFQSYEAPTEKNAAACVANLESRITAYEEANKNDRRPNFSAKPNADLSTRVSNIESSILVILQYLRHKLALAEADKKNGVTQSGSGRTFLSAAARSGVLDAAMRLRGPSKPAIRMEGSTLVLGVMGPEESRKLKIGRK